MAIAVMDALGLLPSPELALLIVKHLGPAKAASLALEIVKIVGVDCSGEGTPS